MTEGSLAELPATLCRVFLGWRLREDFEALVALGEGALRIDLVTAESWLDGDPLPPLFIAGELRDRLAQALQEAGLTAHAIRSAQLEAVFAARARPPAGTGERGRASLEIACRATIATDDAEFSAEANNASPDRSTS